MKLIIDITEEVKKVRMKMNKKLARLTVSKSADYYDRVVKALENTGFLLVLELETPTDRYYIVAERESKEINGEQYSLCGFLA